MEQLNDEKSPEVKEKKFLQSDQLAQIVAQSHRLKEEWLNSAVNEQQNIHTKNESQPYK